MIAQPFYGPGSRAIGVPNTFARTRSDAAWVHLVRTKPLRPIWHDLAALAGLLVFGVLAFVFPAIISKL